LIKVEASPINPSDVLFIQGKYLVSSNPPFVIGSEGSGVVVKAGGKAGEHYVGKKVGFTGNGTYAQYIVTEALRVIPIPEDIDFNEASCCFVNPMSVIAMLDHAQNRH